MMPPGLGSSRNVKENKEQERREKAKLLGPTMLLVTQLGLTMAGSIFFCLFIGFYLDKWLNTKPIFIIIFIILGVAGGGYTVYRQVMEAMSLDEEDQNGKGK